MPTFKPELQQAIIKQGNKLKNWDHKKVQNWPFHVTSALLQNNSNMFSKRRMEIVFAVSHNPSISFAGNKFRVVF
jgi:hypothetical protein